ncbi:MAG: hypothetical protein SLagBPW_06100 [Shewanella algae]
MARTFNWHKQKAALFGCFFVAFYGLRCVAELRAEFYVLSRALRSGSRILSNHLEFRLGQGAQAVTLTKELSLRNKL